MTDPTIETNTQGDPPRHSRIGRRIAVYVILFGLLMAIVLTSIQMYSEYRRAVSQLVADLDTIEIVHLPGIAQNLLARDLTAIELQLQAIAGRPGIQYLELSQDGQILASAGMTRTSARAPYANTRLPPSPRATRPSWEC